MSVNCPQTKTEKLVTGHEHEIKLSSSHLIILCLQRLRVTLIPWVTHLYTDVLSTKRITNIALLRLFHVRERLGYILISSHLDCHHILLTQSSNWAQLQMHNPPARVLMRTEYISQDPINQISFDLVQFHTLILWPMSGSKPHLRSFNKLAIQVFKKSQSIHLPSSSFKPV